MSCPKFIVFLSERILNILQVGMSHWIIWMTVLVFLKIWNPWPYQFLIPMERYIPEKIIFCSSNIGEIRGEFVLKFYDIIWSHKLTSTTNLSWKVELSMHISWLLKRPLYNLIFFYPYFFYSIKAKCTFLEKQFM